MISNPHLDQCLLKQGMCLGLVTRYAMVNSALLSVWIIRIGKEVALTSRSRKSLALAELCSAYISRYVQHAHSSSAAIWSHLSPFATQWLGTCFTPSEPFIQNTQPTDKACTFVACAFSPRDVPVCLPFFKQP